MMAYCIEAPGQRKKKYTHRYFLFITCGSSPKSCYRNYISGTGEDGTTGLKKIKDQGGITFAQDIRLRCI